VCAGPAAIKTSHVVRGCGTAARLLDRASAAAAACITDAVWPLALYHAQDFLWMAGTAAWRPPVSNVFPHNKLDCVVLYS